MCPIEREIARHLGYKVTRLLMRSPFPIFIPVNREHGTKRYHSLSGMCPRVDGHFVSLESAAVMSTESYSDPQLVFEHITHVTSVFHLVSLTPQLETCQRLLEFIPIRS